MPKTPPPFSIHVDGSCLTDSTDLERPKQRDTSSDTVVHNPPKDEDPTRSDKRSASQELLDEKIQAQIHEAARKVVADYERARHDEQGGSLHSARTEERLGEGVEGTELSYAEGTELTYDGTEATYETDQDDSVLRTGIELDSQINAALDEWEADDSHIEDVQDSSSQHGDDDDNVFSENSGRSQRSSLNSVHDLTSSDEAYGKRLSTSSSIADSTPDVAQELMSRIPSMASYTPDDSIVYTPSKSKNRPPFRTPSSVRAMQMTSPTPSIFASPRSAKRHLPNGSRLGTPTSQFSPSKRTPTRFKAKKEEPLNLLHVTVMPIQWLYAHAMNTRDTPESMSFIKENWRLLYDKLADTVLERGILLPHPQDSYEVLEERLLEALELPIRPRAAILKCGHYMGPSDIETPSSDEDDTIHEERTYFQHDSATGRKWCDICRKDVKLENTGEVHGRQRFNVKIYASNGLMRAGAWAAAWREMERVDVEIEPWVESSVRAELEEFAASVPAPASVHDECEDDFVDEDDAQAEEAAEQALEEVEQKLDDLDSDQQQSAAEQEIIREFEEEERKHRVAEEEKLQRLFAEEKAIQEKIEHEEEMRRRSVEAEKVKAIMARPSSRISQIREGSVSHSRRTTLSEDRTREIYGHSPSPLPPHIPEHHSHHTHEDFAHHHQSPRQTTDIDPDSLLDLLFAAFKVLLRDKKNIAIGFLSILVLLLALKPHTSSPVIGPSTAVLASPVSSEKGVGVVSNGHSEQKEKESVVSYVTVTATATSVATSVSVSISTATADAETVVVTMTRDVDKVEASTVPEASPSSAADVAESIQEAVESDRTDDELLQATSDKLELTREASITEHYAINDDELPAQDQLE